MSTSSTVGKTSNFDKLIRDIQREKEEELAKESLTVKRSSRSTKASESVKTGMNKEKKVKKESKIEPVKATKKSVKTVKEPVEKKVEESIEVVKEPVKKKDETINKIDNAEPKKSSTPKKDGVEPINAAQEVVKSEEIKKGKNTSPEFDYIIAQLVAEEKRKNSIPIKDNAVKEVSVPRQKKEVRISSVKKTKGAYKRKLTLKERIQAQKDAKIQKKIGAEVRRIMKEKEAYDKKSDRAKLRIDKRKQKKAARKAKKEEEKRRIANMSSKEYEEWTDAKYRENSRRMDRIQTIGGTICAGLLTIALLGGIYYVANNSYELLHDKGVIVEKQDTRNYFLLKDTEQTAKRAEAALFKFKDGDFLLGMYLESKGYHFDQHIISTRDVYYTLREDKNITVTIDELNDYWDSLDPEITQWIRRPEKLWEVGKKYPSDSNKYSLDSDKITVIYSLDKEDPYEKLYGNESETNIISNTEDLEIG